jgi:hypothetical protein
MADVAGSTSSLLTPRKILIQTIGFLVGMGLLAWIVYGAVRGGNWEPILHANPLLVAGLAGCSLISALINGVIFWVVIRPVAPLRLRDLTWVNLTTAILNYAPIRAGLLARVAYHLRVDRMKLVQILSWLVAISFTMVLTLGACVVATILRPQIDWLWALLIGGQLLLGGLMTIAMMGQPIVVKFGRGLDRMLRNPIALWGAIIMRLIDIGAYFGRMSCAVAILQLKFTWSQIMILALAALALSINPLGRFGYREAGIAIVASLLASSGSNELRGQMDQLALLESAGEAIVFIPLGLIALVWYRRRWINAKAR